MSPTHNCDLTCEKKKEREKANIRNREDADEVDHSWPKAENKQELFFPIFLDFLPSFPQDSRNRIDFLLSCSIMQLQERIFQVIKHQFTYAFNVPV